MESNIKSLNKLFYSDTLDSCLKAEVDALKQEIEKLKSNSKLQEYKNAYEKCQHQIEYLHGELGEYTRNYGDLEVFCPFCGTTIDLDNEVDKVYFGNINNDYSVQKGYREELCDKYKCLNCKSEFIITKKGSNWANLKESEERKKLDFVEEYEKFIKKFEIVYKDFDDFHSKFWDFLYKK